MMGERGRATLEWTGSKTSAPYRNATIALTFIRPHVAPARVLRIGARLTALIGFQQMTEAIGAAIRVASIYGRAAQG